MDKGFAMVIGMSIAYIASFIGLVLAWRSYRKHHNLPTKLNYKKQAGKRGEK